MTAGLPPSEAESLGVSGVSENVSIKCNGMCRRYAHRENKNKQLFPVLYVAQMAIIASRRDTKTQTKTKDCHT